MSTSVTNPYSYILKLSFLIGGSLAISQALGVVRLKTAALLIGPIGIGLLGSYSAIQGLAGVIFGLGIQSSAIRNIAEAVANNDTLALARISVSLRRICWLTGSIAALSIWTLSGTISILTFQSNNYSFEVALIGLVCLIGNVSSGYVALIRGFRQIGDMARMQVVTALIGTVFAILCYVWLGLKGIIPSLLLLACVQFLVSRYFVSKLLIPKIEISWKESLYEAGGMVKFGFAFMWSALLMSLVAYLIRALIANHLDLVSVGIYSAAFSISGMLINFILAAMGADFYPRLTAVANNHDHVNRMVNEQTEIGLLLAIPGLLATLTLAPWLIRILFTDDFILAIDLLKWFTLGCFGQVIAWPLGFVMLALGKGRWFATTESIWNLLHFSFVSVGLILIGLEGVAVAYFAHYIFVIAGVYGVAYYLTGFRWTDSVVRLFLIFFPMVFLAFGLSRWLTLWPGTIFGLTISSIASLMCLRALIHRIGDEHKIARTIYWVPGMRWVCGLNRKMDIKTPEL